MIKTVSFSDFVDSFSDTYKNNFTYAGKRALYDYLEQYEEDTGEKVELDTVTLCCEYNEHENALECAKEYHGFTGTTEEEARTFLEDNTQVIDVEGGGVIILAF